MKKARGDSKLKTLDAPIQAQLWDICKGPDGYAKAREWLLENHAINVKSDATFSEWFKWYPFSLSASASFAQQFEQEMAKLPEMQGDAEKLSKLGQLGFEMMAMRMQDIEGFATLKKLRLKEIDQQQVDRRIRLLEKAAEERDQAKKILGDSSLTEQEQARKVRALFGMGA